MRASSTRPTVLVEFPGREVGRRLQTRPAPLRRYGRCPAGDERGSALSTTITLLRARPQPLDNHTSPPPLPTFSNGGCPHRPQRVLLQSPDLFLHGEEDALWAVWRTSRRDDRSSWASRAGSPTAVGGRSSRYRCEDAGREPVHSRALSIAPKWSGRGLSSLVTMEGRSSTVSGAPTEAPR
jgi:hypothetical protein